MNGKWCHITTTPCAVYVPIWLTFIQMKSPIYLLLILGFLHCQSNFEFPDSRCVRLPALLPLSKDNWKQNHITSFEIPYFALYHKIKQLKLEKCEKTIENEKAVCRIIGFNNFLKYLDPVDPNSWSIQAPMLWLLLTVHHVFSS